MSAADEPSHEHQVGITNAQEHSPDAEIRRLTADMNALFAAHRRFGNDERAVRGGGKTGCEGTSRGLSQNAAGCTEIPNSDAKTMKTPRTIDEVMRDMN